MNTVSLLIEIILPVFGVVAIGYGVTKMGWIAESAVEGLSQFVFNIAIPVLLFRTIATTDLPQASGFGHLVSYFAAAICAFGLSAWLGRLFFGLSLTEGAIFAMCSTFSNSVLIGIPLVLLAFGDQATLPLFFIISVHGIILFSLTTVVAEIGLGRGEALNKLPATIVKRLLANPILVGLILGLFCNLAQLPIPRAVDSLAATLGAAALPCATFAMGASISRFKISGALPQVGLAMVVKLLVLPVMVWILGRSVFELPHLWISVAVVLASLPAGVNTYLFAERYGVVVPMAASNVLLGTFLSVFSVSGVLLLLGVG